MESLGLQARPEVAILGEGRGARAVAALCLCLSASPVGGWTTFPSDSAKWEGRRYAWPIAEDTLSDQGLSGGLAYAIDPAFCARMRPVFREDKPGEGSLGIVEWITCDDINDALARAMTTWSSNHPYVSFYNVTDECLLEGKGRDCTIAEVYIDAGTPPAGSTALEQVAAYVTHNPIWRKKYSNNERWETGVRMPNGDVSHRDWQLKFAMITFHDHLCWYLDNTFCSGLRSHNDKFGNVALIGSGVTFSVWTSAFLYLLYWLGRSIWLAVRNGLLPGLNRTIMEASRWMFPNYVCVFLIIAPPIFWLKMFLPCIECYDFEATAAHELGHVLGFGHPDKQPEFHRVARRQQSAANCCLRSSFPSSGTYGWVQELNCSSGAVQAHSVEFDPADPAINESIMFHLTTFKSRACLTSNDKDGLLWHYPVCDDSIIRQGEPICVKPSRNIGWVRVIEAILPPFVLASLVLFIFVHLASRMEKQETNRERWSLAARTALRPTSRSIGKRQARFSLLRRREEAKAAGGTRGWRSSLRSCTDESEIQGADGAAHTKAAGGKRGWRSSLRRSTGASEGQGADGAAQWSRRAGPAGPAHAISRKGGDSVGSQQHTHSSLSLSTYSSSSPQRWTPSTGLQRAAAAQAAAAAAVPTSGTHQPQPSWPPHGLPAPGSPRMSHRAPPAACALDAAIADDKAGLVRSIQTRELACLSRAQSTYGLTSDVGAAGSEQPVAAWEDPFATRESRLPQPASGCSIPTQAQSDVLAKWAAHKEKQQRSITAAGPAAARGLAAASEDPLPVVLRPHPDFLGSLMAAASSVVSQAFAPSTPAAAGSALATPASVASVPGSAAAAEPEEADDDALFA